MSINRGGKIGGALCVKLSAFSDSGTDGNHLTLHQVVCLGAHRAQELDTFIHVSHDCVSGNGRHDASYASHEP